VNATPQTVHVNDTVDITIRVAGNGYKMARMPITVMLDMDTTSNMNAVASGDKLPYGNGLERFPNSKIAAQYFVVPVIRSGRTCYIWLLCKTYLELIAIII
jgi:hypothetical protein